MENFNGVETYRNMPNGEVLKVSIIIPVYNVEKYIKECLDSVLNQTLKDIEVICINDCSPDNCLEILNEYAQKDKRVRVIDLKENQGMGNARNLGIQEAKGQYIMFLDSDDFLEPQAVEEAYKKISENDNDFVIFDYNNYIEETDEKILIKNHTAPFQNLGNKNYIKLSECDFHFLSAAFVWNKIYKLSFIKENEIKFSHKKFFEDLSFAIRAFAKAENFSYMDKALYNYRKKANGVTTYNQAEYYDCVITSQKNTYEYVKSINNKNLSKTYLIYTISSTLRWFDKFTSKNSAIKKDFYSMLHNYYQLLNEENDIRAISSNINYKLFKLVLNNEKSFKYDLYMFKKKLPESLFYLNCSKKNRFINITIFGVKFKIEKH